MAKKINTSSVQGGSFEGSLTQDNRRFFKKANQWTQARNAVNNTVVGDIGDLSNEASNYLCVTVPYTIIGTIHLQFDEWAIFSTDDTNSEIGIFKESTCTYEKKVNDWCLNFNKGHLIKGVGRTAYNCGRKIYWDDGINPTRVLDLDNIPWVESCTNDDPNINNPDDGIGCNYCEPLDPKKLDCDKIRLAPLVNDLAFRLKPGNASGQLLNGSYYVVGAYLIEGQRVTDYSLPSNIQGLFTHDDMASSLDIFIDETDLNFDEFELVIVQFANFNTVARRVGIYSTKQKKISLDHIDETWSTIDPGLLLIQNPIPDKSDALYRNGEYLLRVGPTDKFDFNYQPLANQIKIKWVSVEYDDEYYRKGGSNTGYMRDEVYPFFIRWVYNTGDKSKSYHIPGRVSKLTDLEPVIGVINDDVLPSQNTPEDSVTWKVYNTATVDLNFPNTNTILPDGGRILGGGEMSYWQSSEYYDDDAPEIWNSSSHPSWCSTDPAHDLCGKNIRHHKFPDNRVADSPLGEIANHYDPHNGRKIRIMGIQVENIKPPLDNNFQPIKNIVGYEILRGSREGNKSVLAKGMINNMRTYKTEDKEITFLYPNYPYNPTAADRRYGLACVDHFLSSLPTTYARNRANSNILQNNAYLDSDAPLINNIEEDLITFHSPETNFRNPFLSAKEIKIYGELHGEMDAQFQLPKDHPRHKFISDTAFVVSAIIGIGYALLSTEGEKTTTYTSPKIDYGGTKSEIGVTEGSTGMTGPSAIAAVQQLVAVGGTRLAEGLVDAWGSYSALSTASSILGIDPNFIRTTAMDVAGFIGGSVGGQGGEKSYTNGTTPWAATPSFMRSLTAIPAFLTFWSEGIDKIINLIYAFTPYRQYALQQVSHCFYNKFEGTGISDRGHTRREISFQNYLNSGFQDFAQNYRINNLFRSRTVAIKLESGLRLPWKSIDDTQQTFSDIWGRNDPARWQNEENINSSFKKPASSYYAAMKQRLDNQYGQLQGIIQVPVSTNCTELIGALIDNLGRPLAQPISSILFNGDTYIGRYTEKNTMFFFYDWLKGQPDGTTFDYRLRKMVPHPRFWMNTDLFDSGEFVSGLGDLFTGTSNTVPGNFDPYMIANYGLMDPSDPTQVLPCECGNTLNCRFGAVNVNTLCSLENQLYDAQLYVQYLRDCTCFVNVINTPGCNTDGLVIDPTVILVDPAQPQDNTQFLPNGDPNPNYNPREYAACTSCTGCPNLPSGASSSDEQAGKYLQTQTGTWRNAIDNATANVANIQNAITATKNNMYNQYLDQINNTDNDTGLSGFFNDLNLPTDHFAFDLRHDPTLFSFNIKEAFMYLFNSGVRDFFVESEINVDYRDYGSKPEEKHYDFLENTNLKEIFSTDHIKVGNYMKYDYSLSISKMFNSYVSWGSMQARNYDPVLAETCYLYRPKRVLYSLPQSLENQKDNWRIFLPMNYKDFNSVTTTIKPVGKNGALMFFENESPVQFLGMDVLQTDAGTKITIGDGGLFSQPLQNLVNAEYPHQYGSCQSRLSVANTPTGTYYISQNQGKIFQVTSEGLRELSGTNLKWWFARYLPYQLTQHSTAFLDPTNRIQRPFQLLDNPVIGIGCQTIYDNENGIVYFCKKDWVIRTDIFDRITYLRDDVFLVNGKLRVKLGDPLYFAPASWTISWDPKANGGNGDWLSWHDWHPELVLPSKHTYMTTITDKNLNSVDQGKGGIWVHADRCDSYCNFYGVDYPFEVEFTLLTTGEVNTLRNVLYFMETYIYGDNCDDRFHDLDFNFDNAIVYNSEQCSGLLKLNVTPKNNVPLMLQYPKINFDTIDILYSKEEQKYRFNQFWDITADRGEFNPIAHRTIFNTQPNGYIRDLNAANLNYQKEPLEHKKFRHYMHSVWLSRAVCGSRNMVISLAMQTNLNSSR